jgi:two-component system osmolarity sensor histidine kinase EnvZ
MPKKNFLQTLSTKTLLGRFTLILLVPIVLLQAVNSYIFYQRHWDNVTSRMQTNLAEEIGVICNLIHNKEDYVIQHKNLQPLKIDLRLKKPTDYIKKNQHNQKFINRGELKKLIAKFVLSLGREYYELQELKAKLAGKINRPFSMYYSPDASNIIVDIALDDAVLSLELSHKRVQSPTANIFIAWMLGVSFLLYTIAIMFMRNQLKSIAQLTAFADELGKGHQMHDFKPCGAIEIKRAGE